MKTKQKLKGKNKGMNRNNINTILTRYIPVTDWEKHHEWPPIGGLRHLIFNRDKNGFDKVVKKIGRRVLIDELAFFDWVEKNSQIKS